MTITNGYATRNQVKAALRIGTADTLDDDLIDNCVGAASRLIDGYCNRKFWQSGTASRVYQAEDSFYCSIDDIAGTAITLKTSSQADGTFDVTWKVSDYQLEPLNGNLDGLTWSYDKIRAVGDYLFPTLDDQAWVQVTAVWGWSAVPPQVTQANILQAARLFKRYDSPLGVAGFGDFGAVRVSRSLDPDVAQLVEPLRRIRNIG